jgi:hypothetical protein
MKSFEPTHAFKGLIQNTVKGPQRNLGIDIRGDLTRKQARAPMGRDNWASGTTSML